MTPSAREDEQVHVLQVEEASRSRLPMLLGLLALVVVAGAGVFLWLNPDVLGGLGGGTVAAEAPPAAADNLLGDAWSFETTDALSAVSAWTVPVEAPGGFAFLASGASSGELGAVAQPGEAGWARAITERAHPLGAHRGAVELSGQSASDDVQLLLRFESAGRRPIDIVVASGRGAISGTAPVPPGATSVRAGIGCIGAGSVDDLVMRFVDATDGGVERRGIFDLLALPMGALVFRGDELVLEVEGLTLRTSDGVLLPSSAVWLPGENGLGLPDGTRIGRQVQRFGDDRRLELSETLVGVPSGAATVRSSVISGSLAAQPIGIISSRGFEQFTDDFRVEEVAALVLGRTQDRLAIELGEPATFAGTWQPDGTIVVRTERAGNGTVRQDITLQTNFQDERVAAAQHRDAALAAERGGRLGEALAEVEIIVTRFPHDEDVTAEAQALRGRIQAAMQARLDGIDRDLEDALFLASAARCREVLDDCLDAATTFEGSVAAERFRERADTVARRAADLLEEDRLRRSQRIEAVARSFREAGGFDHVADELDAYLAEHLAAEGHP